MTMKKGREPNLRLEAVVGVSWVILGCLVA